MPKTYCPRPKTLIADYIESGTFQAGEEEDASTLGFTANTEARVLLNTDFIALARWAYQAERALLKIAQYDEEPIWQDDRDDSANEMLSVARKALGLEAEDEA